MKFARNSGIHMLQLTSIWIVTHFICSSSTNNDWQGLDDANGKKDTCFCQLSGQIDDCCCSIEDVDSMNRDYIYPRVKTIVNRDYFRYVKLKLYRDCPFWKDSAQCSVKDCSVDVCTDEELPPGLKAKKMQDETNASKYSKEANEKDAHCAVGEKEFLGDVDTTIGSERLKSLESWPHHEDDFCVDLEENAEDAEWVDLHLNPERFTGYAGAAANRIWGSIYKENCFLPGYMRTFDEFKAKFLSNTCLEKRVFYRTVSGLHASVNLHLSYNHLISRGAFGLKPVWGPDINVFKKYFDPVVTNGQGPFWLKNIYFTYLIVLRAVAKALPYWQETDFFTGNAQEDSKTQQVVLDMINATRVCPSTFDESLMFSGDPVGAAKMKEEFRLKFKNITRIMDCVGCAKCRLWGKLEANGLGTAFKILFSSDKWDKLPTINGKPFQLTRSEIVSLFIELYKLSDGIHILGEFRKMTEKT